MTLKSLNTRYLLIRKIVLFGASLLLGAVSLISLPCWSAEAIGFNRSPALVAQLFDNEQKLTASDGAQADLFGEVVAASGATIVVSARVDNNLQGAVYVFNRRGGSWVEMQKLTASDGVAGDQFSDSVAISGSTIIVGAPRKKIGSNRLQGAVYVFERQGGNWVETQRLIASDGLEFDFFGGTVAISGSTIVVGVAGISQSSAYVFQRQGGSWVETQKLTASDANVDQAFGISVAVSGSTIVVGASFDDIGSNSSQGSAYVFERRGRNWVETQKLTASDGTTFDTFGNPVAISGSTIVVGVPFDGIGSNPNQGSVYVFNRQGGSWVETQRLTASDGAASDLFGISIGISDSTIVVGASLDDVGGNRDQGSAYVFNRQDESWVETQRLTASDLTQFDSFGHSVAVSGSAVVVGTPFIDIGGNVAQGAAYVFEP